MIIWIVGLSGAGKTTLANKIVEEATQDGISTVLIDGDVIRDVFGNDIGHTMADRLVNAQRICHLGKFLDDQGINVVCAILSIIFLISNIFTDSPIMLCLESIFFLRTLFSCFSVSLFNACLMVVNNLFKSGGLAI